MFRKNLTISVDWPEANPEVEIGENSLENGIFQLCIKEMELNNKNFIVEF